MSTTTQHRHKLINYLKNFEYNYFELKKLSHGTLIEMTIKQLLKIQLVKKIQNKFREYKNRKIINLNNEIKKNKKEIFNLTQNVNDLKYKNNEQKKYIKYLLNKIKNDSTCDNTSDNSSEKNINYICKNKKTYNITNKLSNYKLTKELKENDIEIKNKNHHNLKQEVNRLNNRKYNRLIDKIINK